MKKKLLFATAIIALASCADNTYLGDQESSTVGDKAISFGSEMPQITRGTSADAAKLNYSFKVFGVKTVSSIDQRVFATATAGVAPYWVWFVDNTANSTTSNSGNWEYVGTKNTSYGTTGHEVTINATTDQTIKYWDMSATNYDFQAWSDVNASPSVTVSAIEKQGMTLSATPAALANFYISDLQTGAPGSFTTSVVNFTFRKAATNVRLGIYETVPGYHVRNLKFMYTNSGEQTSEKSGSTNPHAILDGKFVGNSSDSKTFDVTYETTSPHRAILTPSTSATNTTFFDFGEFIVGDDVYLGETTATATWANTSATDHYTAVFPNTTTENIADMTLKVSYELYNENSGEVIAVNNKTAKVPAAYMTWKPNYAYTYLFKITDDQLTPITLDAIVIVDAEGKQETITTVTEPSITTYARASNVTVDGEYKDGATIYSTVMDGSSLATLSDDKIKLYTVTTSDANNYPLSEASVLDAILKNSTLTTAEAAAAKITYAAGPSVTYGKKVIDYDGNNVELDASNNVVASFTGATDGSSPRYYAIVYEKTAATYTVDAGQEYTESAYNAAGTLYTNNTGTTKATSWSAGTTYYKRTAISNKGSYAVKIIKVVP